MQMKFDKELLLKHKFWIVLGLAIPSSLAALFLLTSTVGGQIAASRKKLEDARKKIETAPSVTRGEIESEALKAKLEKAKESVAWALAYKEQAALFRWPDEVEQGFDFMNGLFAYEIKVDRAKEDAKEAKPEDKAEEKKEPSDEDPNPLEGVVEEAGAGPDVRVVKGTNGKKYTIRRTQNLKIVSDDKDIRNFPDIRVGDKVTVSYNKGKYFMHDALTDSEQAVYVKIGVYHSQIDPILRQVDPMRPDGKGVVQLKGWLYEPGKRPPGNAHFFTYLENGWVNINQDLSEEAWLAQEDLWIQKEIYRLIRLANDEVSKFGPAKAYDDESGKDPKRAPAPGKTYSVKNPYWQLDLKWDGAKKLNLTLKNRLNRRQKVDDLKLRIRFHKKFEPEVIRIDGKPVQPANTKDDTITREITLPEGVRTGIYGVEQALTWETAAVKRVDHVSVGVNDSSEIAHSHRTFPEGTRPYKAEEKADGAPAPGPPGMPPMPVPGGPKGLDKGEAHRTQHGLLKKRYVEVTTEARRVPVAVVLIVDQDHIDRVETAFENSKLRFLLTQVLVNRYGGSLRPMLAGDDTKLDKFGPGFNPPPLRGGEMGQPSLLPQTGGDDMESNVELVLYGVVTLYERFPPPRNKAPAGKQ